MTEPEPKIDKRTRGPPSPLARAFDHCPSALFDFLTDRDAACVACALCEPQFLSSRRYEIKAELALHDVLAGRYPCVIRNVKYNEFETNSNISVDWALPSELLSTVTRLTVWERYKPLDLRGVLQSMPMLREFDSTGWLSPGDLPRSLTKLRIDGLKQPFNELPPGLTKLEFYWWTPDVPMQALSDLPASLTDLTIYGRGKCGPAERGSVALPASLIKLKIVCFAALDTLPPSLEDLELVGNAELFPVVIRSPTLRKLVLPENYSSPIRAADFPLLTELTMAGRNNYPHELDHLPASLTKLTLRRRYTHPLDKLPSSLLSLTLHDYEFNQPLDHLPASLTELLLHGADQFNQPLDHLPPQLQVLSLGMAFNQPLDALQSSLVRLDLSATDRFNRPLDHLPDSLQVLSPGSAFNQPLASLPSSLIILDLSSVRWLAWPLNQLPESLQVLRFGESFNRPFQRLPRDLTELDLRYPNRFDHPLPLVAPEPLPDLDGSGRAAGRVDVSSSRPSSNADHKVPAGYPTALRSLCLGRGFNQPLTLPCSLTRLSLHARGCFEQPLPPLPAGLTELQLPDRFVRRHPEYRDKEALWRQRPNLKVKITDEQAY